MSKVPESHALVLSLFFGVTRGFPGSSHHGSVEVNRTSIQEDTGSIPALAQEVTGLAWPWAVVCGLLLLWCRLVATAPIQPLAWERPCAGGCGPYKTKKASNAISPNFWGGKLSILKASNTKGTEKMCSVELKIALNFQKPTSEGTEISEL